jgi:hypothetical protein
MLNTSMALKSVNEIPAGGAQAPSNAGVFQPVGDQVTHAAPTRAVAFFTALPHAVPPAAGVQHFGAQGLAQWTSDDDVQRAGFVFQRDEDDAFGGAGLLAERDDAAAETSCRRTIRSGRAVNSLPAVAQQRQRVATLRAWRGSQTGCFAFGCVGQLQRPSCVSTAFISCVWVARRLRLLAAVAGQVISASAAARALMSLCQLGAQHQVLWWQTARFGVRPASAERWFQTSWRPAGQANGRLAWADAGKPA